MSRPVGRTACPVPKLVLTKNNLRFNSSAGKLLSAGTYDIAEVEGGIVLRAAPANVGRHKRHEDIIAIGKMGYGLKDGDTLVGHQNEDGSLTFTVEGQ